MPDLPLVHVLTLHHPDYGVWGDLRLCRQRWTDWQAAELADLLKDVLETFYNCHHGQIEDLRRIFHPTEGGHE
jgi:hypothetical protein